MLGGVPCFTFFPFLALLNSMILGQPSNAGRDATAHCTQANRIDLFLVADGGHLVNFNLPLLVCLCWGTVARQSEGREYTWNHNNNDNYNNHGCHCLPGCM